MIITLSQRDVSFGMFYGLNDISDKMITSFVSVAKNTDDIDQKIKDHQLGRSSFFIVCAIDIERLLVCIVFKFYWEGIYTFINYKKFFICMLRKCCFSSLIKIISFQFHAF